jgi:uncharacterized protein (DUF1697 family)
MRNEKLRVVFESLGFANVQTVISSGNVIFDAKSKDAPLLESKIEEALLMQLKIRSTVFIRSKEELEKLIAKDPFKGADHSRTSYLVVTFMKKKPREIFNILNVDTGTTPDFMQDIEKKFGKEVTTRTWKTIMRIAAKWK